ncbi:hypothetical exported protein [Picrophilus oshimae DSM 9789]|uniref:Hypothetical exported protein n=2 Tax=Picrophilus oshimae TaxID=46632 RepID=Q6L0J4_PICTO|nr:hypothetical exported protein [Picrophilus oshimae DSM 9789]
MKMIYKAMAIALTLILVFGIFTVVQPHQKTLETKNFQCDVSSYYYVVAHYDKNCLYNNNVAYYPEILYTNITKNLTIYDYVSMNSRVNTSVEIMQQVLIISNSPKWEKIVYENITRISFNGTYNKEIYLPVNFTEYQNVENHIDAELGYPDPGSVSIVINSTINSASGSSETGIGISSSSREYSFNYGSPAYVDSYSIKTSRIGHPYINIPLIYSYIIVAGSAVSLILIVSLSTPKKRRSILEKTLSENDIIEVDYEVNGSMKRLSTFDDLAKLAEIYEDPIFYSKSQNIFFIEHDNIYYFSEVKDED